VEELLQGKKIPNAVEKNANNVDYFANPKIIGASEKIFQVFLIRSVNQKF
jgi:hypothetical protein